MKLYLNFDNYEKGLTFAWNAYRGRATAFDTKLEAETAALKFSARYPEYLGILKVTWTKKRLVR